MSRSRRPWPVRITTRGRWPPTSRPRGCAFRWSKDLKTITFTIRHGVKWSDGRPFSAQDVYYTLVTLPRKYSGTDQGQLWTTGSENQATGVTMPAPDQVAIHFKTVDTTRFYGLVSGIFIVPQHIWSKIKNPATYVDYQPPSDVTGMAMLFPSWRDKSIPDAHNYYAYPQPYSIPQDTELVLLHVTPTH